MIFAPLESALTRTATPELDPERVAIYRNNCRRALARALSISYAAIERLVGTAFFERAAYAFIDKCLPRSACLDDYGTSFAEFLERFEPARSIAWLADVARLEEALNRALHAADADALDLSQLAGLEEEGLARWCFTPHPSLTLLKLQYPADRIWQSVIERDEAAMAAVDLADGPVHLLVERDASDHPQVSRLEPIAWRFTRSLAAGTPLHVALEDEKRFHSPEVIAALEAVLAGHLAAGRFVACGRTEPI